MKHMGEQTSFQSVDFRNLAVNDDVAGTLQAKPNGGYSLNYQDGVLCGGYVVRRLTPLETERLQGMPDDHTNLVGCDVDAVTDRVATALGYDEAQRALLRRSVAKWSRESPDSKRYKCVGNSFAVPCVRWIGERIQMVSDIVAECATEQGGNHGQDSRE